MSYGLVIAPGLTGALGVLLYTAIVACGGDSWGMRNRFPIASGIHHEVLSSGVEGIGTVGRRADWALLIAGTGLGTEVSGLTANYQRSGGNGTEKVPEQAVGESSVNPNGLARVHCRSRVGSKYCQGRDFDLERLLPLERAPFLTLTSSSLTCLVSTISWSAS